MTAAEALRAARAAGVDIRLDGDDLVLEAPSPPSESVLDALSRNKTEIVALLRRGNDCRSPEDWQISLDERAGIAEFDGGLPPSEAEMLGYSCCLFKWPNRNPLPSPHGGCLDRGTKEQAHEPMLPFRAENDDRAWPHHS